MQKCFLHPTPWIKYAFGTGPSPALAYSRLLKGAPRANERLAPHGVPMKFTTFEVEDRISVGLVATRGGVDLGGLLSGDCAQVMLEALIDRFDELRDSIEDLAATGPALPLEAVALHAAVPAPGKV